MGTFLFIILLLLFMLLYPVIKAAFKVWLQVRQMKRNFTGSMGQRQYTGNSRRGTNHSKANRDNTGRQHRHGKIFGPGDGEYVEFEEIAEQRQSVQYIEVRDPEPRITDAKFEDI